MIIGLDVGGTHTDVVLLSDQALINAIKVPTDHADLFQTVLSGLTRICEGVDTAPLKRIVLSTTLTTNAIAQGQLPPVGIIVASGPGLDPEAFRTGRDYYTVSGSIDHRGREFTPIDRGEIKQIAKNLAEAGIKHVGVVGKFSTRNPAHEIQIKDILQRRFDRVFLGHEVSGSLNFSRRIASTFLNASVYPLHKAFFDAVQNSLHKKGLQVPIFILKADGGTMSLASSMAFPGQAILSGPAASVMGAVPFTPLHGEAMVLDIGGTTTDMALVDSQVPRLHPVGVRLGGYQTLIRSLDTRSIGIGGDSTVRVEDGQFRIGPERSGPAMAFGGSQPTPTDALVTLGILKGDLPQAAYDGMSAVGQKINRTPEETAHEVFNAACGKILSEIQAMVDRINNRPVYTVHEIQENQNVNPRSLLVLGGPAPYFAERLTALSDYSVKTVPRWEVANAIGAALARTTCEVTLLADTQKGSAIAPEEDFDAPVDKFFDSKSAVDKAYALLQAKALQMGADSEDMKMEVLEELQFNMVRGFNTTGKNIRVKVQIKPGLIHGYASIVEALTQEPTS